MVGGLGHLHVHYRLKRRPLGEIIERHRSFVHAALINTVAIHSVSRYVSGLTGASTM